MNHRTPTAMERRVVSLVAEGLNNREIAERMGTTEAVVKNNLCSLYNKFGLWNRVELALWYEARQFEHSQQQRVAAGSDPA